MPFNLDAASKFLTVCSLAIAVVAAGKALPLDAELKKLASETQRLDNELKLASARLQEAEAQLKQAESGRKLSFDLYQEVKKVLEKKERSARDEEALRVLIESLAEDPFRYKLLSVLAVGSVTDSVKQLAAESSRFYQEEAALASLEKLTSRTAAPAAGGRSLTNYDVDIFFCVQKRETSEPVAKQLIALRRLDESGRWRLRALPETINQQPGYGVRSTEIRYNAPDEAPQAQVLVDRLAGAGVQAALRVSSQSTPWYLSVFVCQ
jgi:hypothetical protein